MVGSGELLHELEEKMEVARVQLQLVEAIGNLHRTQDVEASIAKTYPSCMLNLLSPTIFGNAN